MNYALILAGGVGQRMRNSGMPKQFLEVFGKPVIVYTLEKFVRCDEIDRIVIVCNGAWMEHMRELIQRYAVKNICDIVAGGKDRQLSIKSGIAAIQRDGASDEDIIVIHDGVRPLIQRNTICETIRAAKKYGGAITVKPVMESVVITQGESACFRDFQKRDDTYSLTAPQTFKLGILKSTYEDTAGTEQPIPLLDTALAYAFLGNDIRLVKENNANLKITTPEDYYMLKAMLELEENKYVFGL